MTSPYRTDAEAIARRINPLARSSPSGWWPLPGICHDRRDRPHLGVRDNSGRDGSDVVSVKCWVGCDRETVRRAIERETGWRIWGLGFEGSTAEVEQKKPVSSRPDRIAYPMRLWQASERIERDDSHPARKWISRRGLYWSPPIPLPSAVRWLPAGLFHPQHLGVGAIIAPFAPPERWLDSWPRLPVPTGVELVHLDLGGMAVLDRPESQEGLSKRSYGIRQGAVCLLGDPRPDTAPGLTMVEGLADALSLAARYPETVAAVGGVSGLMTDLPVDWLSRWARLSVYADDDHAGVEAARRIRRQLGQHNIAINAYTLSGSHNDPAAFAEDNPLGDVDLDVARDFAADLEQEGLPRWEAARLALLTSAR